jgi:flagellar biogenesis protein FliO
MNKNGDNNKVDATGMMQLIIKILFIAAFAWLLFHFL